MRLVCSFMMDIHTWVAAVILAKLVILSMNLFPSSSSPLPLGWTSPKGDIRQRFGESLTIHCLLNEQQSLGKNASSLVFLIDDKIVTNTTILNETTIQYYNEKPPPLKKKFSCKLKMDELDTGNDVVISTNLVHIDKPPQKPTDAICVSKAWKLLQCTWSIPERHLDYDSFIAGSVNNSTPTNYLPCSRYKSSDDERDTMMCQLSMGAKDLPYNPNFRFYHLKLEVSNALGSATFNYVFEPEVIGLFAVNIKIMFLMHDSGLLVWDVNIPSELKEAPLILLHEIHIYNYTADQTLQPVDNLCAQRDWWERSINYNMTELVGDTRYAALINIRVKDQRQTGQTVLYNFTTPPYKPPVLSTLPGCFRIVKQDNEQRRHVHLYWESNDTKGSKYQVQLAKINNSELLTEVIIDVRDVQARFTNVSLNSLDFKISTWHNSKHSERNASWISIPPQNKLLIVSLYLTKIVKKKEYTLLWQQPAANVTSYTLLSCHTSMEDPSRCNDKILLRSVSARWLSYRTPRYANERMVTFALAANSNEGSSGMIFEQCVIEDDQLQGKLPIWAGIVGLDTMDIHWTLECLIDDDTIRGINFYYCTIASLDDQKCQETQKSVMYPIKSVLTKNYTLTGLDGDTWYMITATVLTSKRESARSGPIRAKTLETRQLSKIMFWTFGSISVIIFLGIAVIAIRKLWKKFEIMRKIELTLPIGITLNNEWLESRYRPWSINDKGKSEVPMTFHTSMANDLLDSNDEDTDAERKGYSRMNGLEFHLVKEAMKSNYVKKSNDTNFSYSNTLPIDSIHTHLPESQSVSEKNARSSNSYMTIAAATKLTTNLHPASTNPGTLSISKSLEDLNKIDDITAHKNLPKFKSVSKEDIRPRNSYISLATAKKLTTNSLTASINPYTHSISKSLEDLNKIDDITPHENLPKFKSVSKEDIGPKNSYISLATAKKLTANSLPASTNPCTFSISKSLEDVNKMDKFTAYEKSLELQLDPKESIRSKYPYISCATAEKLTSNSPLSNSSDSRSVPKERLEPMSSYVSFAIAEKLASNARPTSNISTIPTIPKFVNDSDDRVLKRSLSESQIYPTEGFGSTSPYISIMDAMKLLSNRPPDVMDEKLNTQSNAFLPPRMSVLNCTRPYDDNVHSKAYVAISSLAELNFSSIPSGASPNSSNGQMYPIIIADNSAKGYVTLRDLAILMKTPKKIDGKSIKDNISSTLSMNTTIAK